MYDVITVGSATLDVFAKTRFSELIKIIDPRGETDLLAYPSGSKILIDELTFEVGGGGTNTAVSLSRLGHKVAFMGKLGNDENSRIIATYLKKERIRLLCAHGKGQSGFSVILDTLEHDRTILTHKGVNDDLKFSELNLKELKTKWFYFSSMMETSFKTQEKLSDFAKKNGIKIAFNPSSYLAVKGSVFLTKILRNTDLLILNLEEAEMIVGKNPKENLLKKLMDLGPKIVVITDGKNEMLVGDSNFIYRAHPPIAKVVDATGAGDAFASSFLSGLIQKGNVEFAIRLGVVNAQSVVAHYGAKNILLKKKEALKKAKNLKIKILKKKI